MLCPNCHVDIEELYKEAEGMNRKNRRNCLNKDAYFQILLNFLAESDNGR